MDIHFLRSFDKNITILIAVADTDDLVECLNAHRAGIHAQTPTEVARNPFHPLKACDIGIASQRAELLEFDSHAGGDFHSNHFMALEFPARKMGDYARDASVSYQ